MSLDDAGLLREYEHAWDCVEPLKLTCEKCWTKRTLSLRPFHPKRLQVDFWPSGRVVLRVLYDKRQLMSFGAHQ